MYWLAQFTSEVATVFNKTFKRRSFITKGLLMKWAQWRDGWHLDVFITWVRV